MAVLASHIAQLLDDEPDAIAPPTTPTAADAQAAATWAANRAALAAAQPRLLAQLEPVAPALTWTYARDGSLSGLDPLTALWWGGNSLPRRSAGAMLETLDRTSGGVSCLLAPHHGAQIRAALDLLDPEQAVLVVQPDLRSLRVALHTTDLVADVTAGRLWFVAGEAWAAHLEQLLRDHPGLPVPARFVRLPDLGDGADPLIAAAQPVFAREIRRRGDALAAARDGWSPPSSAAALPRVCVIAPSRFRPWRDAGRTLALTLAGTTPQHVGVRYDVVDTDRPAASSPLAVQAAALAAGAVVSADVGRADHPNLLPPGIPWVTWVTTPRVPAFDPAARKDAVLLADPAWRGRATEAGWPADRVAFAAWPAAPVPAPPLAPCFVMIADTGDLACPAAVEEFSSHRLLWEAIRTELTADPFALPADVDAYLASRLRQLDPTADAAQLDRAKFIDDLILPAYAQGLARALLGAGAPVALYGAGWPDLAPFKPHARGPVRTRGDFAAAVREATAVVRPWPFDYSPQLPASGRPVIRAADSKRAFLSQARDALDGNAPTDAPAASELSSELVLGRLAWLR